VPQSQGELYRLQLPRSLFSPTNILQSKLMFPRKGQINSNGLTAGHSDGLIRELINIGYMV
jgi:hypothetical protein